MSQKALRFDLEFKVSFLVPPIHNIPLLVKPVAIIVVAVRDFVTNRPSKYTKIQIIWKPTWK